MEKFRIKECRVCGNNQLVRIGSLGDIALSNFTDAPQKGIKRPLTLVYCEECTLLQLEHNTPRDLLYKDYWYQSHINPVIVNDLKEIAEIGMRSTNFGTGDTWIDIGGNDGTLLSFVTKGFGLIVDPAKNITLDHVDQPRNTGVWNDYWENVTYPDGAKVITTIACLYDLPDPNKFVANIKKHLERDGIFICQLMTLQPMMDNNDIGNVCHEHLEYYSYKSLVRLYEQNGLEIFKVEKNNINGGSYRIFARHLKKGSIGVKEKEYTLNDFRAFFQRIEENKKRMIVFIATHHNVVGYGASTKMNTILQYYGINSNKLNCIVDINPDKKGKVTINTGIPIVDKIPHYTEYLWVFPYGFIEYFKKKEKNYKGKWVTTIPKFKIL